MEINSLFITTSSRCKISKNETYKKEAKETDTLTFKTPDTGFMNAADKIYRKIDGLKTNYNSLDRMNARNVVSIASNAICKGNDIHTSLSNIIYRFQAQIGKILCSGYSEEEIESKIKDIEDKINAAAKEANVKMDILISLSDSLFELGNIALDMKNNDMDSYSGVDFIEQLIEKLNTKVDDFSKSDTDKDSIDKKIYKDLDNIYGKESRRKLEKKKEEYEKRMDNIKDSLQSPDLSNEETNRLRTLLNLYNHRINAISNILDIFDTFSSETVASDADKQN